MTCQARADSLFAVRGRFSHFEITSDRGASVRPLTIANQEPGSDRASWPRLRNSQGGAEIEVARPVGIVAEREGFAPAYFARASRRMERATVIAVMCTIVSTFAPCCSTLTGFFIPSTIGPITSPSPIIPSNL